MTVCSGRVDLGGLYRIHPVMYSGELITAGACAHLESAITRMEALGLAHGFFLELEKSQFVKSPGVSE